MEVQQREFPRQLRRLDRVWVRDPDFFITICTEQRRPMLAAENVCAILCEEWRKTVDRHGWAIGTYCVMSDHVHFFCADSGQGSSLSEFVGRWKEWTAKRLKREAGIAGKIWQRGFFDHVLRSSESREEKWEYVRNNPVRAGLVDTPEAWPFMGHIHYT